MCWRRKPLFEERYGSAGLVFLLIAGLMGAVGMILVGWAPRPGAPSTGIIDVDIPGGVRALMTGGFVLAPIAWLALNLKLGRRILSVGFILSMAALLIISFSLNARLTGVNLVAATALFFVCF